MKSCSLLLIVCFLSLALGNGCGGSGEETTRLKAEVASLIVQGQAAEKTSYAEAATLYQEALAKAEAIVEQDSSVPMKQGVAGDEMQIGSYTLSELRDRVLPLTQQKAEAEESPLASALLLAQATKNPLQKTNLLSEIAKAYAQLGQQEKVREIVLRANDASYEVLDTILAFYFATEQYEQAWKVTLEIEEEELKNWAAEWLALQYIDLGQPDEALRAAQEIVDPNTKADTLIKIADAYTEDGQRAVSVEWGGWRAVDQWIVPRSPRRVFFFPASKEKARDLLQLAKKAANSIEEFTPKTARLVAIALAYNAAEDYDQVQQIVAVLREAEVKARVLTSLASRYAATGQRDATLAVLKHVEKLGKTIVDPSIRTAILKNVARVYIAAGEEQTALGLAGAFKDSLARSEVMEAVVRKQAATGRQEDALRLAHTIAEPSSRTRAIRAVSQTYAEEGQPEQAKQLITEADRDLPMIAHRYAVEQQYDQARQVAEAIVDTAGRATALLDIALEQLTALDVEQGAATLKHAMQTAEAIPEPAERETTRTTMTRALLQAQQFSSARQVVDSIGDPVVRANLLMDIAYGLYAAGDDEQGALVLTRGLQTSRSLGDVRVRDKILTGNARQMASAGRFPQALEIATGVADVELRATLFANVARMSLDAGHYDDAFRLANTILDTSTRSQTLAVIVRKALSEERDELARQYTLTIPASTERDRTLAALANWYVAHNRLDEALTIEAMIKTASLKIKLLREAALSYLATDQEERALQLLERISDPFARAALRAAIARHYASTGRRTDALQFAQAINDAVLRERTIKTIIKTTAAMDENETSTEIALLTDRERFIRVKSVINEQGCNQARQAVNAVRPDTDRVALLLVLARKCEEDKQAEQATTIFAEAQQEAATIRDPAGQARALVNLVRQLTATGRVEQALIVARQIKNEAFRVDACARVAQTYLDSGNLARAVEIAQTLEDQERADRVLTLIARKFFSVGQLDQATAIIEKIADASTQTTLYLAIARTYAQDGSHEQANRFLARAQQTLQRLDSSERAGFLSTLVSEYVANGDVTQALRIAREVTNTQVRVGLFSVIAKQEVRKEHLEQALKLANEIEDPVVRVEILSEITTKYLETGSYENAFLVASTVAAPDTRAALVVKVARDELTHLLAEDGRAQDASALLLRLGGQAEERPYDNNVMPQVVRLYLEMGLDSRAVQMLPFVNASREKALLLAELTKIYTMRGENKKAEIMFVRAFQEAAELTDEEEKEKAVTQVSILLTSVSPRMSNTALRSVLRKVVEQIDNRKIGWMPATKNG